MAKSIEKQLEDLERVARNVIERDLRMECVEDIHGMIYIAHGVDKDGDIVGLWGVPSTEHQGPSRILGWTDDLSLEEVRNALITDAMGFLDLMAERNLLNA